MIDLSLETEIVDRAVFKRTVEHCRDAGIRLPTFAELAEPGRIPEEIIGHLASVDPDAVDPWNLFRVHWMNTRSRRERGNLPQFLELPTAMTGVRARIVLLLGDSFPLIRAHKVLAAYACLAPRLVTGRFDAARQRAVWPSTGNYCRGGVAISRILRCRGVAVLPEGMSRERFEWLERWVERPEDIMRTPGTESNVKEIYDRCDELAADEANVVFNQFSEFPNYLVHYNATGQAVEGVYRSLTAQGRYPRLFAFVAASGSAGTLGAGDYVKRRLGAKIVAAEALECPTLLANGFGEHNIQGIGDKHVPLIHNVMNTDVVVAVSERDTNGLFALFNSEAGRRYLGGRKGLPAPLVESLPRLGLSAICNLLAAIKTARYFDLGEEDMIVTVATDGAELYHSEIESILERDFSGGLDEVAAAESFGRHLAEVRIDNLLELTRRRAERIFNLGYFTWVEQRGVSVEDFVVRKRRRFWRSLENLPGAWDRQIEEFNRRTGAAPPGA